MKNIRNRPLPVVLLPIGDGLTFARRLDDAPHTAG